jgi:two-component system, chemotaxis family, chemotaxis protein CheY
MRRTLLIVDDSGDCAETLEFALAGLAGCSIDVVHSAEDAMEALDGNSVVGLITDLHLPKMQGLELVRFARSRPHGIRIAILVVSGDSDPRTPARALEAGADCYFPKPYSPAGIRRQMEKLLPGVAKEEDGSA